jgi:hypothetical protein
MRAQAKLFFSALLDPFLAERYRLPGCRIEM